MAETTRRSFDFKLFHHKYLTIMHLQYLTDERGRKKSVVIPISEWNELRTKYKIKEELETSSEEILDNLKKDFIALKNDKLKTTPVKDFLLELKEEDLY